jgi:uncharacterized RDD family membrane protein YckC
MRLRRTCAYVADAALWELLAMPALLSCVGTSWGNRYVPGSTAYWIAYLSFLACNAPEVFSGASVGHRLIALRITSLDGGKAPLSRRLVRAVLKYVPIHLIVLGEGFGLALNDPLARHDRASHPRRAAPARLFTADRRPHAWRASDP